MIKLLTYTYHSQDKFALRDSIGLIKVNYPHSSLGMATGDTWSSPKDLQLLPSDHMKRLHSWIHTATDRPHLEMWANVIKNPGYIGEHNHFDAKPSKKSGVYYLTQGTIHLKKVGKLTLHPGTVLLFPAEQIHQTLPHFGVEDRITIAFNVW